MAVRDMTMVQFRIPTELVKRLDAIQPMLAARSPFARTSRTTVTLQAIEEGTKVLEMQQAEMVAEERRVSKAKDEEARSPAEASKTARSTR